MIRVREWRESHEVIDGQLRELTDCDVDFINDTFHLLVEFDSYAGISHALSTITMLGIPEPDWWYEDGLIWFTHQKDRDEVQIIMKLL